MRISTSIMVSVLSLAAGIQAAQAADHFKPLGPDRSQGPADSLVSPNDFEAAAAAHPDANGLVFFSLCRRAPFTTSTMYAPFAPGRVDAVVSDTKFTLMDGTQCFEPQNGESLVINPANSQNIVTAASDFRSGLQARIYYSTDGGQTFTDVVLPGWDTSTLGKGVFKKLQAGIDPVLAFSPDGTLYYSAVAFDVNYTNRTPSGVAVAVSHDGGASWQTPVMVHFEDANTFLNDKESVVAGTGGDVYLTWTMFKFDKPRGYVSSNIVEAVSHNYGKSWSGPVVVSDSAHPFDQGSSPAVAPDGTLFIAYEGNQATDVTKNQIVLARSNDHGRTFTNVELGRVYDDVGCYPLNVTQGRHTLSFEQFRINSFPSLSIDATTGAMAIAWVDDQKNPGCAAGASTFTGVTSNQVKLVTTADGRTWTAPKQITSGSDKAFPAVTAAGGRIAVGYRTRDFSPVPTPADHSCQRGFLKTTDPGYPNSQMVYYPDAAAVCLDYAFSSSADQFASENRVTLQSANPYVEFSGSLIGDYTGIALDTAGTVHAVWTDSRGHPEVTAPNQDTVVATLY